MTGPVGVLTGPVSTGEPSDPQSGGAAIDLAAAGYTETEYFVTGTASAYTPAGPLGVDGKWAVTAGTPAAYKTRIVVRAPAPARFNGTVLIEWLNVTAGIEAAPEWAYVGDEIVRSGTAYVGVSVQALGVMGGTGLLHAPGLPPSAGLRAADPARYGTLVHPGDRYSFDIFTQVGRAVRASAATLFGRPTVQLIAAGESQSAFFLTTYVDAVQPIARVFDAFFLHSRGGGAPPLSAGTITSGATVRVRDDLTVPVFIFETQTDVGPLIHYSATGQPDTPRLRVWEVAGTAHADAFLIGQYASVLGCRAPINDGPQHYVAEAAVAALERWVTTGVAPPSAPRLTMTAPEATTVATDGSGNAIGGVRTPAVDVPVSVLSGAAPPGETILCALFGSTQHFSAAMLTARYGTKARYLAAFTGALDRSIRAGYLLASDREALLAQAERVPVPS